MKANIAQIFGYGAGFLFVLAIFSWYQTEGGGGSLAGRWQQLLGLCSVAVFISVAAHIFNRIMVNTQRMAEEKQRRKLSRKMQSQRLSSRRISSRTVSSHSTVSGRVDNDRNLP